MRLRVVRCEKCGGTVQLREGADSAVCSQCGTTATLEAALRAESERARRFPNPTPLRLGMKGRFKGQEYELIGRLAFSEKEEGVTYRWDEFELIAADGDTLFLEYEDGSWKLMETFVPEKPLGPQEIRIFQEGSSISLDGTHCLVKDIGVAEIDLVEGELTFAARAGDRQRYLEASSFNRHTVIEWSEDAIEFYQGQTLSDREVFQAFGLKEQLAALDTRDRKLKSRRLFAAVCLMLSLLSFIFWGGAGSGGKVVSRGSIPIMGAPRDGVRTQPFRLDPRMRVHRLIIHGSMREASAWVAGVLEAADGRELIGAQRTFWDESGHDSDGYWHESDLRTQTDFLVKNPGPYRVHLYVERDSTSGTFETAGYELRGGVLYPGYFLTYGIVTLLVAILFFILGAGESLKKMAESSD